ncbi:MAG: hypothetical protein MUE41_12980 [Gemmatimonadaceae bacterium]|nr:hypothetical protein [Gemmatimonadaceae bacterium]
MPRFPIVALLAMATLLPSSPSAAQDALAPSRGWIVRSREHVDLWLHGFAVLSPPDSAVVPLFAPGYRDAVVVAKNTRNILTALDANGDSLRARYARSPQLLQAQFLAFRFTDWNDLAQAFDLFIRADGEPRRAPSRDAAAVIAELASVFTTARDRDWARLFVESLRDEQARFHGAWWREQQAARRLALLRADSLWATEWQPALLKFLTRSQQRSGELMLSLPLAGEGRAAAGRTGAVIAVPLPERVEDAAIALYVTAHEAVGTLVGGAIADNTTPAEQRAGVAARYVAAAQVVAGHELLTRLLPATADGYAHYYLAARGRRSTASGAALARELADAFPLPPVVLEAIRRQIEITLGGI